MSGKKVIAAIAGKCAHAITKKWALEQGLTEGEASALAWVAGAIASTVVMQI